MAGDHREVLGGRDEPAALWVQKCCPNNVTICSISFPSAAIPRKPGCTISARFWLYNPCLFRPVSFVSIKFIFRTAFLYIMESDRKRSILPQIFTP